MLPTTFNFKPSALLQQIRHDVLLRSALISSVASLLALLLLSLVVWSFVVRQLENRVEEALIDRHRVALENSLSLSDEERAVIRKFRGSLPIRDEGIFAWVNSDGVMFANNATGLYCQDGFYDGWADVTAPPGEGTVQVVYSSDVSSSTHDRFRFLAKERGDNCLVFGRSLYEVDALRASFLSMFWWLVPVCLLPSLIIGLRQSFSLRRRLRKFGAVVELIARGNLDARIPVEGDDDIDHLSKSANRSFDRLQESVNTLQHLTSVMAHDLRAPLHRVAIPLDEAMRANQSGETAVEWLEEVKGGLADVRDVFDALLRISQIESGRRRAKFANVDLFEIAEKLFEIYQPVLEDSNQILEFEITGEGTSTIYGDAELITQAVVNLVANATHYAPAGAVIRIGVMRDARQPALIVRDDGPGLPAEERPRVLRRLYRYQGSTAGKSGHGLGLSLVKAVVDLHEGQLTLEDAEPGLLVRLKFEAVDS